MQRAPVKRLGINLGGQNFYDSGQMLRNLIFRNPGFEGQTFESIIQCAAVTATSCTDQNPWNGWTANFLAGASYEVINGAAKGETGTITGNTISDYAAGNTSNPTRGVTVSFAAPSTPLAAGDFLILRMETSGDATAGWWTNTSGGATLSTDTTDIAPDSPGKQALAMTALQNGQSASVNEAFDTWGGRSFVQMQGTYTLEFKAKGVGGNNQLNVSVQRLATAHGNENFLDQNITLTNQWKDYSYTFNANEDGSYIGPVQVVFSIGGAAIYLDDAALNAPAAPDNPTAFRNEVVDTLRELRPGVIRYMTGTDFGTSIANAVAVPFARRPANSNPGTVEQTDIPMGLEEFLVLCQAVGAEPWYTMAGGASTADMQNLMEFLGGSTSTPFGALRASLGQSAPWTSVFPKIHIELGNEMWNGVMVGEAILDPVAYGQRAAAIFAAAHASPSYDPDKIDLIMGSWANVPWYTQQEMNNSSGYDSVDAAPYLYYTLSDTSSDEAIFGPMFAQPEQLDSNANGYMAQQAAQAASGSAPANLEVYEVNLSTVQGTAPQNVVNQVVAGVGAGITVADHMLLMMRDLGITTQNLFCLTEYMNGFSNTATGASETTPLWGAVVDMGGATNLKRPQFLAEALANSAILPTMLKVGVTGANPTWNQALSANDTITPIQLNNAHYLQSFVFTDGTHYSMIVFNLSRSGSLPITFSGPNAPTGDVLVSQLTSAHLTDNNETSAVVSPTQTNLSNFNPATPYSLPPFSMTVFEWPNSSLPATNTVLAANPASGNPGDAITLTATVTSKSGSNTPTGTVNFMNGTSSLGTATLDGSGGAGLTVKTLSAGTNSITAVYGGDAQDAGSSSPAVTVTITSNGAATNTSLSASPTQISTGQSVTFTAKVAPQAGSGIPTGTVTFMDGASSLGTATLNASGVAAFSTSTLSAGTRSITASYGGDSSNNSSVSPAVTVDVTQTVGATTTTLTASATQIAPGQNVTFTAKVSPHSGSSVPSGTVTFLDGAATLGTGTLNGSGAASFSTTTLSDGAHSITASYGGDSSNDASVSPAVAVNVSQNPVETATALATSVPQIATGDSVTFTAKVQAQSGSTTPTGTIAFLNGSAILGTSPVNAGGTATFTTSALPAGSDSITASYGGASGFGSSVSPPVVVTVTQSVVATTTSLAASASQIDSGQRVTFTALVAPQSGTATPSGTVTFFDGAKTLGTATLNSGGTASLSTTSLAAGNHSITASYGGSSSNSSSLSAAVTVTVAASSISTTTSLTASATQIDSGQSVTFTAVVAAQSGTAKPGGSVVFLDGGNILGTAALGASGKVSFSTTSLAAGAHSITASYSGSAGNSSSSSAPVVVTVTQTVTATATVLTASATQLTPGQTVVLSAMVQSQVQSQSGKTVPAGTVTFLDGSASLGSAVLNGGGGSLSTAALTSGTHVITASYGGSTADSGSVSSPLTVTVVQIVAPTTTKLTASAKHVALNQNVTFTAIIASQSGGAVSTGTVAFIDGSNILGTAQLNADNTAAFSTSSLAFGSHSITASYSGSNTNLSSVSAPVTVNVAASQGPSKVQTAVSLTADNSKPTYGQVVTVTATVAPQSGSGVPTGAITFLDGSSAIATALLNGGKAIFTSNSLAVGSNPIVAVYSGDSLDSGSVSGPLTIVVSAAPVTAPVAMAAAPTATSLAASSKQVDSGESVSFNATVVPQSGGGTPTGTVTFLDGQTVLGMSSLNASGAASFNTASLAMGTHSITAAYGGDADNAASTSAAASVTVVASTTPGYTMTVSTSSVRLTRGQVANLTVTLTPENGFDKTVSLTCSGMPVGTNCSFNPAAVTPKGAPASSTLSILAMPPTKTAGNRAPGNSAPGQLAFGILMPWGILSLFGRRKNRSRMAAWAVRLVVAAALIAGSMWMSGCGYSVNSSVFTMTLTSSGANVPTHTSQVTVNIAP